MADEVVFFTGVPDKFDFACRLVRKKYREGVRLAVYAPPGLLSRLDQALWAEPERDFLPHVRLKPGAAVPTGDRVVGLLDGSEQPAAAFLVDSRTGIFDLDADQRIVGVFGKASDA